MTLLVLLLACTAPEPMELATVEAAASSPFPGRPTSLGTVSLYEEADLEALCDDGPVIVDTLYLNIDTITDTRALGCVVEIQDHLRVYGDALELLTLPRLRRIGGDLRLHSVPSLRRMSFPRLVEIGGDFALSGGETMGPVAGFPALRSVGGTLGLYTGAAPLSLHTFGALETVGELAVVDNGGFASWWPWPSLAMVTGELTMEGSATDTTTPSFPALTTISGSLTIDDYGGIGPDLSTFSALETVEEDFVVWMNGTLESFDGLDSLVEIGDTWDIFRNENLARLGGPDTEVSVYYLIVHDNDALTTFDGLPPVVDLSYASIKLNDSLLEIDALGDWDEPVHILRMDIIDNPLLASIAGLGRPGYIRDLELDNAAIDDLSPLGALTTLGELTVTDLDLLTSFHGMEGIEVLYELYLADNDLLADISALAGTTSTSGSSYFGDLVFQDNPLLEHADIFEGRTSADTVQITGSPLFSSIATMAGFTEVRGDVILVDTGLASLDGLDSVELIEGDLIVMDVEDGDHLYSLQVVEGDLDFEDVGHAEFDALVSVGGTLDLVSNPLLEAIHAPLLEEVGETFFIKGNRVLAELDLGSLRSVGAYLTIEDTTPATVSLPALEEVGINLNLRELTTATTVELDRLESLPGHLEILDNEALTTVSAPLLASIATDLTIEDNAAFGELDGFAVLGTVGGDLSVQRNGGLSDTEAVAWASALSVGGATTIADNGD